MLSYQELVRHEGNDWLFRAIEMSVLATQNGFPLHLHAEGLRGTGKTTIIRTARHFLPRIKRIKGCLYNCDPAAPHCPLHRTWSEGEVAQVGTEEIPVPFLEISHSAKVGTVVGSIDLGKLTDRNFPQAALLPGTIAQAHRGILFVDEINRLAETSPELADVLLSVMGTKPGKLQIEETGLPVVEIPVSVSVWAASNPDEDPGPLEDIRRQLSDRFDLTVAMNRPVRLETVLDILQSHDKKAARSQERGRNYSFAAGAGGLTATLPQEIKELVGHIYVDFKLESLRALEALVLGSRLHAQLLGRREVGAADLAAIIPLTLRHRISLDAISEIITFVENWRGQEGQVGGKKDFLSGPPGNNPVPARSVPGREGADRWANPWSNLFSRLKERIGSKEPHGAEQPKTPAPEGQSPRKLNPGRQGQPGANSANQPTGALPPGPGGQSSGGGQAANPLEVHIQAPPRPARSILELNLREIFALGEEHRT